MDNNILTPEQEDSLAYSLVRNINMHKRRIINAGDAKQDQDYVTLRQFNENLLALLLLSSSDDTDLAGPVTGQTVKVQSDIAAIDGNGFEIQFSLPTTQIKTYDGYVIFIHDSSTLPTATTYDTGTAGALIEGVNQLVDTTKAFGVNALAGKDIVIFSPKRQGSPSYDYEGTWILANISSNDATSINFIYGGSNSNPALGFTQPYTASGLKYYIVTTGGSNHFHEKLKFYTPFIKDRYGPDIHKGRFSSGLSVIYAWAVPHNYWGFGKVDGASSSTFSGVSTTEIKLLAVNNGRIASLAVTFDKISVTQLSAIAVDAGSITAGTLTGATIRTGASNPRVELDINNGLRSFDSGGGVGVQLPISGGDVGRMLASVIKGISTSITLYENSQHAQLTVGSADGRTTIYSSGTGIFEVTASGVFALNSKPFNGDGSGLTALNATNISTGSLADARLTSNVPLKNAANHFTNDQFIDSSKNLFFSLGSGIADASGASIAVNNTQVSLNAGSYTERARFDNNDSTTQTAFLVRFNGSVQRVKIDASDLGSGVKNYLYI